MINSVYLLAILGILTIGIAALLRTGRRLAALFFALMSITMGAWLLLLFFGDWESNMQWRLWFVRAAVSVGSLMPYCALMFARHYASTTATISKVEKLLAVPPIFFFAASLTPYVIPNVTVVHQSAQPTNTGLLYTLQSLYAIGYFILGILLLVKSYRNTANALQRNQLRFLLAGLITAVVTNSATGYLLTALHKSNQITNILGAWSILFMSVCIWFAVFRHRLFDIRVVIARTLSYALTISVFAFLYTFAVFGIANLFLENRVSGPTLSVYALPSFLLALTFHRLHLLFDHFTNSIFYRDAYDTRVALDAVSDAIIEATSVQHITHTAFDQLNSYLKPTCASMIILKDWQQANGGQIASEHKRLPLNDIIRAIRSASKRQQHGVVFNAQTLLEKSFPYGISDIEIAVVMATHSGPIGVVLLGLKRNGSAYSKQDRAVLATAAKNMAIGIEKTGYIDEINSFATQLKAEVSKATKNLRTTNERLKSVSQAKDEFISMASHQLRPQLAAAQGFVELLEKRSDLTVQDKQEFLRLTRLAVLRMVRLVADMLNASKIQAGKFELVYDTFDLAQAVRDELVNAELSAKNAYVKIVPSLPGQPLIVTADSTKLHEAIYNIIDNAIRYSPKKSRVKVLLSTTNDTVTFKVVDPGIGVTNSDKPKLFRKFFRAQNAHELKPSGTGIGLYVVKKIVDSHGGRIIFESKLGSGSTFGFELPVSAPNYAEPTE